MSNPQKSKDRSLEQLIINFCDTILTQDDRLDSSNAKTYIKNLNHEERKILNKYSSIENKQTIRTVVQAELFNYIEVYRSNDDGLSPFDFDSGNEYQKYRQEFITEYRENNSGADLPKVFDYAFDYIKEASEYYRFFEKFYSIRKIEVAKTVNEKVNLATLTAVKQLQEKAEKAAENAAEKAAQIATADAKAQANLAAEAAKDAANEAKTAAQKQVEYEVKQKMDDVTAKVSETSVTILGIFLGIVLTAVGGLLYSSSVLGNLVSANLYKLIAVSAIVGLVCFNLIALMFRFIERIRGKNGESNKAFALTIIFNILMVMIAVAATVFHFTVGP